MRAWSGVGARVTRWRVLGQSSIDRAGGYVLRIITVDARGGAWRGCGGCSWTDDDVCGVCDTVFVF